MELNLKKAFSKSKILVIGDIMLDHYVMGNVTRISPEAPVPVLLREYDNYYLGGAGNVFSNVHSLEGCSDIISVVGCDDSGKTISSMVNEKSTLSILLEDPNRKTTVKTRYISNSHQLLRVDSEDIHDIPFELETLFLKRFLEVINFYDCVIIEDYNKGLLTPRIISEIIRICSMHGKKTIVDPKLKNIDSYSGCTVIKPNFYEFCVLVDKKIDIHDLDSIIYEARKILSRLNIESILITLSGLGIVYVTMYESYHSQGYPINVSDVSGAGDTVTAMFSLCLSSGIDIKESLKLCNIAGSIACSLVGAVSVKLSDVIESNHF